MCTQILSDLKNCLFGGESLPSFSRNSEEASNRQQTQRLWSASLSGDADTVAHLAATHPKLLTVRNPNDSMSIALHYAAAAGNIQVAREIVARLPHEWIDTPLEYYGYTPFHLACKHQQFDVAALLLRSGADASLPTSLGRSILHEAAIQGWMEAVRWIVRQPESRSLINSLDSSGCTALYWACNHKHINVAAELLAAGADPDVVNTSRSPMIVATVHENAQLLALLLEYGAICEKRWLRPTALQAVFDEFQKRQRLALKHAVPALPDATRALVLEYIQSAN